MQSQLHTPRLILKSVTPQLIHQLFEEKTEAEIKQFFEVDEKEFLILKSMFEGGMETYHFSQFYFLLVSKESNKIIGECGFHSWNRIHRKAELFYKLRWDSDKRKGLMTEAVEKVLKFGFRELDLHRIQALTTNLNVASIKVLERFGFTKEGTIREDYLVDGNMEDSECYSLLKWEWERNFGDQKY